MIDIDNISSQPDFIFQKYYTGPDQTRPPYEALAVLKTATGGEILNKDFFDELRSSDAAAQRDIDYFLVPLAIARAVQGGFLPVAINLHLSTLLDDKFADFVAELLTRYNLNRQDVMLEIVEPHCPRAEDAAKLAALSSRTNPQDGLILIIDDHDFENGKERLEALAPYCEMVKIDVEHGQAGLDKIRAAYQHLQIVMERVAYQDREEILARYIGVAVQGFNKI